MTLPRLTPIAFACATALASSSLYAAADTNQNNNLQASSSSGYLNNNKQITIDIVSGDLAHCLNILAKQADIFISADAKLTNNKRCKNLKFSGALDQALAKLLTGSGLLLKQISANKYVLSANESSAAVGTLATTIVQADDLKDGSAADGYLVEEISAVGPWQGRTLQETPYSINVVSDSLIENLQATTANQVFKINPITQVSSAHSLNNHSTPYMRGFYSSMAHNGISRNSWSNGIDIVMEELAQIEVLTGLSGFFYGDSSIGGTVNYVDKQPTDERMNNISFGNTSGSNLYLHGDFGGQFDENGTFGYRLNVVTQDGNTHVDHENIKRNSIGLVVDWQISDDVLIAISANKRDYQQNSRPGFWDLGGISRPAAKDIDSNKLWSQKWAGQNHKSQRLGASINWTINEHISWRSAYETNETEVNDYMTWHEIQTSTHYNQWVGKRAPWTDLSSGGFSYLDINFKTSDIEHTLTTGWRFSKRHTQEYEQWIIGSITYADLPLTSPRHFDEPDWGNADLGKQKDIYKITSNNFILGDDIKFNQQWSALLGVSLVEVGMTNWWKEDYKESAMTPNLSLIYQPLDNITTYASYSQGFEIGGIAKYSFASPIDEQNVVNGGEVMKPLTSSQIELGAKIDFNGMLLTVALFEIDKALEYYNAINDNQYEFVQDGRQVHRGLEFTATGNLTDNLSLVGGFTLLDAQTKDNKDNIELEGKRPRHIAKQMFKLYGEYNIAAISGLVINAGFSYTGSFYADNINTERLDSFTLFDMGARYNLDIAEKPVTLRVNINNLTDEQYWVGYQTLSDDRRTVSASVSVEF